MPTVRSVVSFPDRFGNETGAAVYTLTFMDDDENLGELGGEKWLW